MKKMYCLVVTDDFSRFSWVFFLATKDETSEILKTFITGIENLIDLRVKVIRCDNGTEFKNKVMNQFCEMKGIKREFSVARTPQQNRVAERKNRTLIEAARTTLADSKLLKTFWAEAVQNHVMMQNSKDSPNVGFKPLKEEEKKEVEDPRNESGNPSIEEPRINQVLDDNINSTNNINTSSDGNSTNNVNAVSSTINAVQEITKLKKRVKKLEGKGKSKPLGMKRLFKIGRSALKFFSKIKVLGAQEDDPNRNDEEMFDTGILDGEEVFAEQDVVECDELAARLQAQEQEELTIEERSNMFVELVEKIKKHFARLRTEEQRRKPPTKAQKRSQMATYLKHMAGYKQNQLKNKNYDEIQKLFDKAMTRVNMFVDMDTELVKESLKKAEMEQESSSKRAGEELESDNSKKQKLDESIEVKVDDEAEMKKHMEIVSHDEVAIDAIPLATKLPIIVD
ncbi:putative ribonuclease H-like domain-containing protein [Tanacetum coccineum]